MRSLNLMSRSDVCIIRYNVLADYIIDDGYHMSLGFCKAHASSIPKNQPRKSEPNS
jgi:hypothetical protein